MPRRETNDVWKEFTKTKDPENGRVNEIWKCNHCPKEYARNPSTFARHLAKCNAYLAKMDALGKDTTAMVTARKPSRLQPTLSFTKMTPERSADLNRLTGRRSG